MLTQRASLSFKHLYHAYAQAPWRTQRQRLGGLVLGLLTLAMVAALYLDISSQAAIAGRQIQELTGSFTDGQQANADLQSQLAQLTSTKTMEERAETLGYTPIITSDLVFVAVPGYMAPEPKLLAAARALRPNLVVIPSEYTESLIDWFDRRIGRPGSARGETIP